MGDVPWRCAKLRNKLGCVTGRKQQKQPPNKPRLGGDRSDIEVSARYKFISLGHWR